MNTSSPLVSVLITAYNRQDYIGAAIESVLASTYTHFELIIVDDRSSDHTFAIAKEYEQKDNRVSVYQNPKNLGDYSNRNQAASYAKGEYVKYLDSDDMLQPWGLQVMVYCMEQFPEAAFGTSANREEQKIYPKLYTSVEVYREYYYRNNVLSVGPTGAIMRRKPFEEVGRFSGLNYLGDMELWLKMSQKYPVVHMPPGLIYWREHEGQETVNERKNEQIEVNRLTLDARLLLDENSPLSKEEATTIIQNLKNIKTRNALLLALKGSPIQALKKCRLFKIGISDVLKALKKNQTIH